MKTTLLILSLITALLGCNKETQENSIYGTWKLVETYGSDGGNTPQWSAIKNGYTYTFNSDGTIISDRFSCNGNHQVSNDSLTIAFNCSAISLN